MCLGEEMLNTLLDCLETRNQSLKFVNGKWLGINKEVAYRIILRCTNKDKIRNLGRYLDKSKHNLVKRKTSKCKDNNGSIELLGATTVTTHR